MSFLGGLGLAGGFLGGALSSYGEYKAQKKAAKTGEERLNRALGFLGTGEKQLTAGFAGAEDAARDAISTTQRGVLDALAALDDGFAAEVRRVMEESAVAQANLDQDLTSRGLYGSTAALNFRRALSGDAQRAMGDIAARFAGGRAGTVLQGAGAVASAQQGLGSVLAGRGQALAGLQGQRASALTQAPIPVANPLAGFGQLGAFGLQAAGMAQQSSFNEDYLDILRSGGGAPQAPGNWHF